MWTIKMQLEICGNPAAAPGAILKTPASLDSLSIISALFMGWCYKADPDNMLQHSKQVGCVWLEWLTGGMTVDKSFCRTSCG